MMLNLRSWRRSAGAGLLALGFAALTSAPLFAQDAPAAPAAPGAPAAAEAAAPSADAGKVLAKVNGKDITQGDVDQYVADVLKRRGQMMNMPGMADQAKQFEAQLRGNAVNDLIRQNLVEAAVQAAVKDVPDAEVTQQIDEIRSFLAKEGQDLDKMQAEHGQTTEQLKEMLRKQDALKKVMADKVQLTPVGDDELKAKFASIPKERLTKGEQVRASHILVAFKSNPRDPNAKQPTSEEKAEIKKKAEDLLAKAKGGEDFSKLAKENSDDPGSKENGGDLNYFTRGQMTPNFEKAAFEGKKDAVSDLVETEFGYHIIKVTDHKDTTTLTMDDVKFQLRESMMGERIQQKMPDLMKELSKDAKVERLDGGKWPPEEKPAPAPGAPAGAPAGPAGAPTETEK